MSGGARRAATPGSALPAPTTAEAITYRARFEQTAMPQLVHGMDGTVTDVNPAMCRLVGRTRDELIGRTTQHLHHASDLASGISHGNDLYSGRLESAQWERVFCQADGSPVPVLIQASLVRDADGNPEALYSFVQDLTTLRQAQTRLTRSTARFEALLSEADDFAVVAAADGRILYASPSFRTLFGYDPAALVGLPGADLVHPEDATRLRDTWRALLEHPEERQRMVFRLLAADGRCVWVEEVMSNRLDHPEIAGIVGNGRDVTERIAAQEAVLASEARYRAIAETAQEGIWVVDVDGRTLFANQKSAEIVGLSLADVYAAHVSSLLLPDHALALNRSSRVQPGAEIYEVPYSHPDGRTRTLRMSVSPMVEAGHEASLAMISDITEVRVAEAQLRTRALHDDLTGLPNRRMMAERIEEALSRARPGSVAVMLADLDDFKLVNDTWGHAAGDDLLRQVAARLAAGVRAEDIVARFGGDEFVILCENVDADRAEMVGRRVLSALQEPFDVDGHRVYVAASIGIAVSPPRDSGTLLRFADTAMYEAKSRGRGHLQIFDVALAKDAADHLLLGNDLRVAIDTGALEMHYQPVIDLATGAVTGLEALARWDHPQRGNVPPDVFVAIAERMGLAAVLDRWAIGRGVADGVRVRRELHPQTRIGVNISAANLGDPSLEACLDEVYADGDPANPLLLLEITENTLMTNPEAARRTLERLLARGVGSAIDDFGTGYSSLAYLANLPVQAIKLDRSFVTNLGHDPQAVAIATAVTDLARALHLRTIAEGVETREQLAVLRRLGCTGAQGWLWTKALPLEEMIALVQALPGQRFPLD